MIKIIDVDCVGEKSSSLVVSRIFSKNFLTGQQVNPLLKIRLKEPVLPIIIFRK